MATAHTEAAEEQLSSRDVQSQGYCASGSQTVYHNTANKL